MRLRDWNLLLIHVQKKIKWLKDVYDVDCDYATSVGKDGVKITFHFYDIDGNLFFADSTSASKSIVDQYDYVDNLIDYFINNRL